MKTAAERKAYQQGYTAGQRRAEREEATRIIAQRNDRWWQVFTAALQGTMAAPAPWSSGEKRWGSSRDYIAGFGRIADLAIEKHGDRL